MVCFLWFCYMSGRINMNIFRLKNISRCVYTSVGVASAAL